MKKITKYNIQDREELNKIYNYLTQNYFNILAGNRGRRDSIEDNQDTRRRFSLSGIDKLIGWKYGQEVAQTKQSFGIVHDEEHNLCSGHPIILSVISYSRLERVLDEYISNTNNEEKNAIRNRVSE